MPASEELAYCSPKVWNPKKHKGYKKAKGSTFIILCLFKLTGVSFSNIGIEIAINDAINLCANKSTGSEKSSAIFVNKKDKPTMMAYSSAAIYALFLLFLDKISLLFIFLI